MTCGEPLASVSRQTTTRDARVKRRMGAERARPGVQHATESERPADNVAISGEFLQSGRRGAEEEAVKGFLVAAGSFSHLGRQGQGHHNIGDGEEQRVLHGQPLLRVVIPARGTMPVLAGMIPITGLLARLAEKDLTTERFGATVFNVLHDLVMAGRHVCTKFRAICGPVPAKDLGSCDHDWPPSLKSAMS